MPYNFSNFKWGGGATGTSSGRIEWSADLTDGLSFDSSRYTDAEFDQALGDAFATWELVASVDFERVDDVSDSEFFVDMGYLEGSTVGTANTFYFTSASGELFEAVETDITMDSSVEWSPYGETDTSFYAVLVHEIGHGLGLGHVADTSEIMNSFLSTDRLGAGDIEGVRTLYGFDVDDFESLPDPKKISDIRSEPKPGDAGTSDPKTEPVPDPIADLDPESPPDPEPDPVPTPEEEPSPEQDGEPSAPIQEESDGSPGFFEILFGWFFNLLAKLFGGSSDEINVVDSSQGSQAKGDELSFDFHELHAFEDGVPEGWVPEHHHENHGGVDHNDHDHLSGTFETQCDAVTLEDLLVMLPFDEDKACEMDDDEDSFDTGFFGCCL